jgi:hypothetical protein
MMVRQTRSAPSPLAGEGWGGGWCDEAPSQPIRRTPTPNPSPQGGGEHTEIAAPLIIDFTERCPDGTIGAPP